MMGILMGIQVFVIGLFFLLGWFIRYKENYWLISGFASRSAEEQQQLIENGWPQKTGTLLMATAVGMLILLPLAFTPFPYALEVQIGFLVVFLLGGFIYVSRYEVVHKRKRSYWISSVLFVVVIGSIGVLAFFGYQPYELVVKEKTFEITGMYGDEWKMEDITRVELMENMPEVKWKVSGFALSTMSKGVFSVKDYGNSLLFLHKGGPYLYIQAKDTNIFINGKTPEQTLSWYEQVSRKRAHAANDL